MKRKILCVLLATTAFSTTALASQNTTNTQQQVSGFDTVTDTQLDVEETGLVNNKEYISYKNPSSVSDDLKIAYLDYDSATPEVQQQILQARCEIVYGDQPWVAEGYSLTRTNTDGTIEQAPQFYDVFPSDWDLQQISEFHNVNDTQLDLQENTGRSVNYNAPADFPLQSGTSGRVVTSYVPAPNNTVKSYASTLPPNYTINIGYTNVTTGTDAGWWPNNSVNKAVTLKVDSGNIYNTYSTRISSPQGSGTAGFHVVSS